MIYFETMLDFDEISKSLASDLDNLDRFLKNATKTDVPLINMLSEHMIESGGKRIRPIILILMSRMLGNDKHILQAGAILELIHAATLLHDDVVDQSDIRHNIKTANKLWGNDSAVLVGDFLYSRAFELIVEVNEENIYKILAETTNKISQGEVMQLMIKDKIMDNEKKYLDIIYLKTGKLFEASALVAAELAGAEHLDTASSFGKNFGIAYQLRNDYLDYFGDQNKTGKNIAEDLSEGKSTLPLIHSFNASNNQDKEILKNIFNNKIISESEKLLEIFKKNKSDIYTQRQIDKYSNKAMKSLDNFEGLAKNMLAGLTKFCALRTR
jgi:octaprenyl-diphosphate synthase